MIRMTDKEKEVLLNQLKAESKETQKFHKEFREQIANLGNKKEENDN